MQGRDLLPTFDYFAHNKSCHKKGLLTLLAFTELMWVQSRDLNVMFHSTTSKSLRRLWGLTYLRSWLKNCQLISQQYTTLTVCGTAVRLTNAPGSGRT